MTAVYSMIMGAGVWAILYIGLEPQLGAKVASSLSAAAFVFFIFIGGIADYFMVWYHHYNKRKD